MHEFAGHIGPHLTALPARPFRALALCLLFALSACGGSGDPSRLDAGLRSSGSSSTSADDVSWSENQFEPAAALAHQCDDPRSGINPDTGEAYADQPGTLMHEKLWIRSRVNETYLWYDEIEDVDPTPIGLERYFLDYLRTDETTASGRPKDQDGFRFVMDTAEYRALAESGTALGYGIRWVFRQSSPPRDIRVAFVEPGSDAASAGVRRGDRLEEVDGVDAVDGDDVETINAALFPERVGERHDFRFRHPDDTEARTPELTASVTSESPVPVVETFDSPQGTLGYLLFQDHSAVSEEALRDAVMQLQGEGVSDLVLDLRYNTGGFLAIASQLSYMIAGDARTAEKTFETVEFNDKHPERNPVTGEPLQSLAFLAEATGNFVLPAGERLPSLNLPRLFVLTGENTCSASESIINGLRGAGVEVLQFGAATCGKPYGFYPEDNCGNTFGFSQFRGVNHEGFGGYQDGFQPGGNGPAGLAGCAVEDDLRHPLGNPEEARLAAAMAYRDTGACPPDAAPLYSPMGWQPPVPLSDGHMPRPAAQRNKRLGNGGADHAY